MRSNVLRLLQRAGIDRAVGFTLINRVWTAFAGLATLVLMTRCLSAAQQGYYFTFNSVLGLVIFFEMGMGLILVQFASHERAGLNWTASGTLEGDARVKSRLASLLRMSIKWYGGMAAVFAAVVLPLGIVFFSRHSTPGVSWIVPWVWIVVMTAGSLAVMSAVSVLEGCGLIAEIARLQMWQSILSTPLLWLALVRHWGLYAAPLTNTIMLIGPLIWLGFHRRALLLDLLRTPVHEANLDWKKEIWPLQWQVALSWVCGYFVFQLFNPVLFATHGAAAAGQMGLSLTVLATVSTTAMSWVGTKSATFGSLIARKDYASLDQLFFPCLWRSWVLMALGALLVWGLGLTLHLLGLPISRRFLAPLPLGLLALTAVINHGIGAEAIYLRAHKREPYLWLSLVTALAVGLSALLLGRPFGATGMMAAYLFISPVSLGVATWLFVQKRREWHRQTVLPGDLVLADADLARSLGQQAK